MTGVEEIRELRAGGATSFGLVSPLHKPVEDAGVRAKAASIVAAYTGARA